MPRQVGCILECTDTSSHEVSVARSGTGWQPTDHTDTPHVILKFSPCPADLPGWRSIPFVQGPHLYPSWPPLSDHAGLASQNAFGLLARTCSTLCRRPLCVEQEHV